MTSISNPEVPFPTNESYGMQQAWRVFFDDNMKGTEEYYIAKTYAPECREMRFRFYKSLGVDIRPPQQDYLDKIFKQMDLFSDSHHKLALTIGSVCLVSVTAAAAVFFCRSASMLYSR